LWKLIKKISFAVKHSLWFHDIPKEPANELPAISNDDDKLFEVTKNIYDESLNRINKLEEKSFKLLSYYTALFAFLSFVYFQTPTNAIAQILILSSLVLLLISILISFRCLNIKNTQQIYINSIYNFDLEEPTENFNKKSLIKTFLQCAIYNENVADNTVDMLNGARYTLVLSLIFCLVSSFFVINNGLNSKESELQKMLNTNLTTMTFELKSISEELKQSKNKEAETIVLQKKYASSISKIDSLQNEIRNLNTKIKKAYNKQINRTP
jgi:hypothetical protein